MKFNKKTLSLEFSLPFAKLEAIRPFIKRYALISLLVTLTLISVICYLIFYFDHLGLAYNDARSHLDIGRRVVEGLKPGLAQLGSVWLPLPHILMIPTIWNDFMWHTGLSGALQSMISFILTGLIVYLFLQKLGVGLLGRLIGVLVFALNLNILYLQSTAMTELLLLATMTAGVYYLLLWEKSDNILNLIKAAFWIMLSTLNRYDGWFLFATASLAVCIISIRKNGYRFAEGIFFLFITLGGIGIIFWFLWNQLIFKDALYFALGPYSAHSQQEQLTQAHVLASKSHLWLSTKIYFYALAFNTGLFTLILGMIGAVLILLDRKISLNVKIVSSLLLTPFVFNVLALYLGFSVLFVQGISGNSLFNVRYGIMMMPSIAIFIGYLIQKSMKYKIIILSMLLFVGFFTFGNADAVTIDDARVGSSQKNVTEVSGWLNRNAKDKPGFILISAASHDAIIFSSGLPMSKFIHEGTGAYWISATTAPDRWARWIIMRTNDLNDQTFKLVSKTSAIKDYNLVGHFPFADIYELKPQYVQYLHTQPVFKNQP